MVFLLIKSSANLVTVSLNMSNDVFIMSVSQQPKNILPSRLAVLI